MYILKVRENANSPWHLIDVLVGPAGHTPIKGTDYFTQEDIDYILAEVEKGNYATIDYVDDAISQALVGGEIDLSDYAKTADLAKVATTGNYNDLTNLPVIPSTTGLATEEYVENAVKNVEVDLTDYYTKSQVEALIPDTTGFALKTEIPDVSNFTTMSAVEAKGYQTATQVQTAISNAISAITDGEEVAY